MVKFSPAPLRAGLGAAVQSCPVGSLRALPAASPSRSIHLPFCWRIFCTTHTESSLLVLAAGFPFRNHFSSSVSENHNQGKFLIWTVRQTHTHAHTKPKNDLEKIPQTPFACHTVTNGKKGGHCLYSTTLRCDIFGGISVASTTFTACEASHLEPFWSPLTYSQTHIFHNRPCTPIRISEFLLRGICKQFKAVPHKQMWEPPDHRLPLEQTKIWCYSYLPVPVRVQTGNLVFPLMSTTFFFFFFFKIQAINDDDDELIILVKSNGSNS